MSKEIERYKNNRKKGFLYLVILWLFISAILAIGIVYFPPRELWQTLAGIGLLCFLVFFTGLAIGAEATHKMFEKELEAH